MTKVRTAPPLSDAEEAGIQAEIAADPDSRELTDAQIAAGGPADALLPPGLFAALTRRGRPKSDTAKVLVTLRLDPAVLDGYRSTGAGWQVRMGEVLAKGMMRDRPDDELPAAAGHRPRSTHEPRSPASGSPRSPASRTKKPA